MPNLSQLGCQKGPKWSSKVSQDGAKKEKKNEVKLGRVSVCLGRVRENSREVVTRPLGEKGRPVGKLPPAVREESEKRREEKRREGNRREGNRSEGKRREREEEKEREREREKRKITKNNRRPSWDDFGSFWEVLEGVLGLLGSLGEHLGVSWRPFGGSWRPLGTSWGRLGRS